MYLYKKGKKSLLHNMLYYMRNICKSVKCYVLTRKNNI